MSKLSSEKRIELAFQAHLVHYQAIRTEIETELKRENDLINFAIAIVAGSITLFAIGQPSIAYQYPIILLILSTLFSANCRSLIAMEMRLHDNRKYIHTILKDKVQNLLDTDNEREYVVLGIEFAELFHEQILRSRFRAFFFLGHYFAIYIPDLIFIGLFVSIRLSQIRSYEFFFLILAILMALVIPVGILSNASFVTSYYQNGKGN